MDRRYALVTSALMAAMVAVTLLAGCGGTKGSTTGSAAGTAGQTSSIAGLVFIKMKTNVGTPESQVISNLKEVTAANPAWAYDPNVTIGVASTANTTFATYTFKDKSTLKLIYHTNSGLPADNVLQGAEVSKL